jgi:hypothetical protein
MEFFCFSCIFLSSSIFSHRNPGSGSALTLNAKSRFALERIGSTTLPTVQTRYSFNYPICYKTKQRFLRQTDSGNVGHFNGILIKRPTAEKGRVRSEKTVLNCG